MVDDYDKKERYVGLFGELEDNSTSEDRREEIIAELHGLYHELVVDYDLIPSALYDKLSEEITK